MSAPKDPSRRNFLRGALTAGAGVAAAVVIAPNGISAVTERAEESQEAAGKQGYRLTQHIVDYYKTASF